jgi:hypothetical protein
VRLDEVVKFIWFLRVLTNRRQLSIATMTIGKGAVIVSPAGNESRGGVRVPITSPYSVARGVIPVGGVENTDAGNKIADFSNSYPSLSALGVSITVAKLNEGLQQINGTTPACAYVAGVAALWWQALRERDRNSLVTAHGV